MKKCDYLHYIIISEKTCACIIKNNNIVIIISIKLNINNCIVNIFYLFYK